MKKIGIYLIGLLTVSCYVPNDPPRAEFSFGFQGRLEKLEDAFYDTKLIFKELDFNQHWQRSPEYLFTVNRNDSTIKYTVTSLFVIASLASK